MFYYINKVDLTRRFLSLELDHGFEHVGGDTQQLVPGVVLAGVHLLGDVHVDGGDSVGDLVDR